MVEQVVRLTVSLTINEGQTAAFNSIAKAMTEATKSEPARSATSGLHMATASGSHFSRRT
jgi:hypothetical protein